MTAQLPLPTEEPPERQITLALTPGLRSLLIGSETEDEDAARRLAASPHLAEARVNLPAIRNRAMLPAGEEGVRQVVGEALATYPQPDRNDAEWAAWWAPYLSLCADLPMMALRLAMLEHQRGKHRAWLPKAGDLRELALRTRTPAAVAVTRIRRAIALAESKRSLPDASHQAPTPEEREEMTRMAAELVAHLAEKTPAIPRRPPAQGVTDARGLTPQIRELLARQNGGAAA
jgi:hypothetical protein